MVFIFIKLLHLSFSLMVVVTTLCFLVRTHSFLIDTTSPINVTFNKPCAFKCVNASTCDVIVSSPAKIYAGNPNLASNRIEERQYSVPAVSAASHSFVTAGVLVTSLAAAILSLSSINLGAIGSMDVIVSDPSMNLLGMIGHLQVFVFSDWISVNLPVEFSETIKGLRWIIPRGNFPWEKTTASYDKFYCTGWKDLKMNLFWCGVAGGGLLTVHLLILLLLRWRIGSSVRRNLSVPRFEFFLLILMIPSISQSSAFVIRGGTTTGIIAGVLLLAIPGALILSVCLLMAVFVGGHVQYKEIKHVGMHESWYAKLLGIFLGKSTKGKWCYKEGLASSFLRFSFLFEDRKGPPVFLLVDHSANRLPKWIESGQSGIGKMRPVQFDDGSEETCITISMTEKLLGCARSAYLVLDLLRRVTFGIISGAYSSRRQSQSIIALALTVGQLVCLLILKPYIRRGVHAVEGVSLLCEAALFGLSLVTSHTDPFEEQTMGFVMLSLLFISFLSHLVNEWYALVRWLLRLSKSNNPSFKLGMKFVAKGLMLPFLPRKYWLKLVPGSSQPSTGLVSVLPLSPRTEHARRNEELHHVDLLNSMTATVVPVLSPGIHGFEEMGQTSYATEAWGAKQQKGLTMESRSKLIKLRELAKASFLGDPKVEGSTRYALKEQSR